MKKVINSFIEISVHVFLRLRHLRFISSRAFKVARVVPVFKGGDPTEFSNYRPVSVLPVLSQVFERVLKVRLVEFLRG